MFGSAFAILIAAARHDARRLTRVFTARSVRPTEPSVVQSRRASRPRLLAVAANSAAHRSIQTLSDLSQDLVAQIEHFFVSHNEMKGKRFEVKGRAGQKRALTLVTAAMKKRTAR